MTHFLQNMEIRKTFQVMTGIIILLLVSITGLGVRQYLLYRHCDQVVARSNDLLFQFTSIKEHINEALLTGSHLDVQEISREIRSFDKELKTIINDILIPEEFKLSFISQIDLVGLVVQLRSVQEEGGQQAEKIRRLNRSLRSISGRFLRFHELLAGYTNSLLLGLHKVIVGTLALVVFIMSSMLFLINRTLAEPLLRLSRTVLAALEENGDTDQKRAISIQALEKLIERVTREKTLLTNMLRCLENALQTLTVEMNDQERWETLCQALLTNPDYIMVWAGMVNEGRSYPVPVAGCGCLAHAPIECQQLVRYLREFCRQGATLCTTAISAMESGRPCIGTTSLGGIPELANAPLPFDPDQVACASFPVAGGDGTLGVITICSPEPDSFGPVQMEMLNLLMQQVIQVQTRNRAGTMVSMENIFRLYQFSIIGALAADVAHEMTNIANGSLNYSQALIDLASDSQRNEEETRILRRLHAEEQKICRLSATLHRIAGRSAAEAEKSRPARLIEEILQLVQGQLKRERIDIQADLDERLPEITIQTAKLQIVLLTILEKIRASLLRQNPAIRQQIHVSCLRDPGNPDHRLLIRIDNCPVEMHMETGPPGPWPSLAACRQLVQSMDGNLIFEETGQDNTRCSINLPLA
ncbi:MAG TPA: hypothetical protein ENI89_03650 [Desulfobulbus sp.]|nr:hypothetical protein [Desulfobulbus sp.]